MKLEKLEDGRVKIYFEDMTSHGQIMLSGQQDETKCPGSSI